MWTEEDYTLVNFVVAGDIIKWNGVVIKVTDVFDEDDIRIIGTDDMWEEDVEVVIPDCSSVPLMVWV